MQDAHLLWKQQHPSASSTDTPTQKKALPVSEDYSISAIGQFVLIVAGGVCLAFAVCVRTCIVANRCASSATCARTEGQLCGFTNVATSLSLSKYAFSSNSTSTELDFVLRGPCSPGDRFQRSSITGKIECVPYFPFPSAYNTEIIDEQASTPHERACGKWISSGGNDAMFVSSVTHRSAVDHSAWLAALESAEDRATASSRTASGAMAKFRAECERTVVAGPHAIHSAVMLAYKMLTDEVERAADREGFLRASGFLSAHSCDSSVTIGTFLGSDGNFHTDITDGHQFTEGVLGEALRLVGEPESVQADAEEASSAINALANSYSTPALSALDITTVLRGATGDDGISYTSNAHSTNLLDSMAVYHNTDGPDKVVSYMRGIAAYCVHSLRANVQTLTGPVHRELHSIREAKTQATALGRLEISSDEVVLGNETVRNASTVTLSQLASSTGSASVDCLDFMRAIFPDHVSAARFEATMTDNLYQRLRTFVDDLRVGLSLAVQETPLKEVLSNPSQVATDVSEATIRIAGAPRGSWAGIARALPEAKIDGSTGVFVMALLQAREQFADRVSGLVFGRASACDHTPLSSSTTLNAYMIPSVKCTVLFLGMAKRPWMDGHYDDESLAARGVMVIAHELAHLTLNAKYNSPAYENLLSRYVPSTHTEAIADVGAALGTLRVGLVERDRLLTHWCQLCCARVPLGWTESRTASHPENNKRCDYLHDTIVEHVPTTRNMSVS